MKDQLVLLDRLVNTVAAAAAAPVLTHGKLADPNPDANHNPEPDPDAEPATDDEGGVDSPTPSATAAEAAQADAAARALILGSFVRDPKTEYSYRVNSFHWATLYERQNDSNSVIEWRCTMTSGMTSESGGGLDASVGVGFSNVGLELGVDSHWLRCVNKETVNEQVICLQPHTKLCIDNEVMECTVTYTSTPKLKRWRPTKTVEENFTVVNADKVRFREEQL
jgi:hypothetical protein